MSNALSTRLNNTSARLAARVQSRLVSDPEEGMVASEYALATAMGASCVGVFYKLVTSQTVLDLVTRMIRKHFNLNF